MLSKAQWLTAKLPNTVGLGRGDPLQSISDLHLAASETTETSGNSSPRLGHLSYWSGGGGESASEEPSEEVARALVPPLL